MNSDDNPEEHPEVAEIDELLDIAAQKMLDGYEVAFEISRYDAEMLLDLWDDASHGDTEAVYSLMMEMGKLIKVLEEQMEVDER